LAVHSLKDLETKHPKGLSLLAVLEREDSRDIIVTKKGLLIDFLDKGMPFVLGTCSPRRAAFSKNLWPNVEIVPLRGNVDSRLQKVIHGELDATILAMAGLKRLGLFEKNKGTS
jgi:hydroxymethylbilane synthase